MLSKIVDNLGKVLDQILDSNNKNERKDSKLRARYAEYYVASKLSDRYNVNIRSGHRGTDLVLDDRIKIEVKSGEYNEKGGAFSFGNGHQISDPNENNRGFDYCVCVAFSEDGGSNILETLIFTLAELQEIKKPRGKNIVRQVGNNSCILLRNYTKESYYQLNMLDKMPEEDVRQIELDIINNPEEYVDRWDKIH